MYITFDIMLNNSYNINSDFFPSLYPVKGHFPIENKDIFSQFPTYKFPKFNLQISWELSKYNTNLFKTNKKRDVDLFKLQMKKCKGK